jgi:hypothetical protein
MFSHGCSGADFSLPDFSFNFQVALMKCQMQLEDTFEVVCRATGRPSVLICDRGLMDGKAYMPQEDWDKMVRRMGIKTDIDIREGRYNAVFHLVTAALGAERFYTTANNATRLETVDEAKKTDLNTQNAWLGHPNHYCFDNRGDFEDKLQRMIMTVGKLVGLPGFERSTTKFLLKAAPTVEQIRAAGLECQVFQIEKVYLYAEEESVQRSHSQIISKASPPGAPGAPGTPPSPADRKGGGLLRAASIGRPHSPSFGNSTGLSTGVDSDSDVVSEYSFIRKRTSNGSSSYGVTTVQTHKNGEKIEIKRIITSREFAAGLKTRDMSRHIVKQERLSFIYKEQSFNIHVYKKPIDSLCILHLQGVVKDEKEEKDASSGSKNPKTVSPTNKRRGSIVKGKNDKEFLLPDFLDVDRLLNLKSEADSKYGAYKISKK